jgi:geranylgeranyl diphosphate synthase type II
MKGLIEEYLLRNLESAGFVPELFESAKYSVLNGGKRLRPQIILSLLKDINPNIDIKDYLPLACAVEFLHCSSLVHDDLPCMDNDDFRRGKPTTHKVFGEAHALLTGDALVALSNSVIDKSKIDDKQKSKLMVELSNTYIELCNGQLWDLNPEKRNNNLMDIHARKTATLFSTCFKFPAIALSFKDDIADIFSKAGFACGIYFQVLDDYLDIVGDPEVRGRPSGSDIKNNRITDCSSDNLKRNELVMLEKLKECEEATNKKLVLLRSIVDQIILSSQI